MAEPKTDLFDGIDYSKGLPKRARERVQCAALDKDGHRCDLPATYETVFHGDNAVEKALWVAVHLCDYHAPLDEQTWAANLPYRRWAEAKRKGLLRSKQDGVV